MFLNKLGFPGERGETWVSDDQNMEEWDKILYSGEQWHCKPKQLWVWILRNDSSTSVNYYMTVVQKIST